MNVGTIVGTNKNLHPYEHKLVHGPSFYPARTNIVGIERAGVQSPPDCVGSIQHPQLHKTPGVNSPLYSSEDDDGWRGVDRRRRLLNCCACIRRDAYLLSTADSTTYGFGFFPVGLSEQNLFLFKAKEKSRLSESKIVYLLNVLCKFRGNWLKRLGGDRMIRNQSNNQTLNFHKAFIYRIHIGGVPYLLTMPISFKAD
ncbi:hypothetical protein C0J52_21959 [Blattella germanica]|nr:hypothetical protein C0J52_21959 [Blattella germanica]